MAIQPGAWYPFRSGSGLGWSWCLHGAVIPPFPTITYSPIFAPAFYLNPDFPGVDPTVDAAVGMKCIVTFHANLATNFWLYFRVSGGSWRLLQMITLIYGSFDYGNNTSPIYLPLLSELQIQMSGATAFNSTLDSVVTLYTR